MLKAILEDVADNLFNPDPYYQQGGDMVRVGGLGYTIDVDAPMGKRISNLVLLKDGSAIDPRREYILAGWGSVDQGAQGPPIWDVAAAYLRREREVKVSPAGAVKIVRSGT
jgi:sulfur-oxidizing protein SoxB